MDKLVRRVTVVQGRDAKVVYQSDDDPFDNEGKAEFQEARRGRSEYAEGAGDCRARGL